MANLVSTLVNVATRSRYLPIKILIFVTSKTHNSILKKQNDIKLLKKHKSILPHNFVQSWVIPLPLPNEIPAVFQLTLLNISNGINIHHLLLDPIHIHILIFTLVLQAKSICSLSDAEFSKANSHFSLNSMPSIRAQFFWSKDR